MNDDDFPVYDRGKVGDDLVLWYELFKADQQTAQPLDGAPTITIVNLATGARVVDNAPANLAAPHIGDYTWTPTAPGLYGVEWHLVHSGGIDIYTKTIKLTVEPRLAA